MKVMFSEEELAVLGNLTASLVEARKGIAAFQALEASIMNAALALAREHTDAGRSDGDLPLRAIAAELGAAVRVSDRSIQRQLGQANELAEKFPQTLEALTTGRVTRAHVSVITDAGARIDDDGLRARFEQLVLPVAEQESASRLKGFARRVAERLMPRTLDERHEGAVQQRRVSVTDLDDGMSELFLLAPSAHVHAVFDRLTQMGRAVQEADAGEPEGGTLGPRSLDQLRADLLCDVALSGEPSAHQPSEALGLLRGEICVTVAVLALAGQSSDPAMLDGVQPVDTATALQLAGAASGWDRVLTHPITGSVLTVDRYRPNAQLRRYLRALDQRCRFPACMMPARLCDLDHELDAALGGPTNAENLTGKCRRHHVLKHHTPWQSKKKTDGTIVWTSPTGVRYPDRPPGRVAFAPDPAPF